MSKLLRQIVVGPRRTPPQEIKMVAAIVRVLARVSRVDTETETFKLLAVFSLLGLLLCVIAARFGLDTSWAFF